MRSSPVFPLIWPIICCCSVVSAAEDTRLVRQLHAAGEVKSLEYFVQRARELHPGKLLDADLRYESVHHAYVYEVQMLDAEGKI